MVEPLLPNLDRRVFIGGSVALLAGAGVGSVTLTRRRGVEADGTLARGYDRMSSDLAGAWWDPGSNTSDALPGIRSTDGSGGWNTGRPNFNGDPASIGNARGESFWQEAQYFRFLSNDRKLRNGGALGDDSQAKAATNRILAQRRLWRTIYTPQELAGDGATDGTINVSDDGAWKLQSLKAIHETTGSPDDLSTLRSATAAVLLRYLDSFTPAHRRTVGGLTFSSYGCLYALSGQDPNGQGRATTYETGIMDAALYLAQAGGVADEPFRTYARTVYEAFRSTLQKASGVYFQTLQLDPARRFDGTRFLTPIDANRPTPRQGFDGVTIGGTMGMAVIAAELFRQTGEAHYRDDVARIVSGIAADYLQNGCIICDRDPWTAGYWGYDFATRALALPAVDPGGRVAGAITNTAHRILATRTPIDVYTGRPAYGYSAEWSGNGDRSVGESHAGANDGVVTWSAWGKRANGGRGGGQASPDQIMTASSSGSIVQAAVALSAPS